MDKHSLYQGAFDESMRYRDQLVKRLGGDVAGEAVVEWNRDHWWPWVADCVLQHVTGECYWLELDARTFASVTSETPERGSLINQARQLKSDLEKDGLISFQKKQKATELWASLLNQLLD